MGNGSSKEEDSLTAQLEAEDDLNPKKFPSLVGKTISITASLDSETGIEERKLGYEIYGSHTAPPTRTILFMHGTPGTRFFFSREHSSYAERNNVQIIVPERPGYGLSTNVATRTLRSSVSDIVVLLDRIGIEQSHVMGYSAGGPFALAFARWYPERCASVCLVSSLSPNIRGVTSGMTVMSKFGYFLAARFPGALRMVVKLMVKEALSGNFDGRRDDFTEAENAAFQEDYETRRTFVKSTLELYSRPCGAEAEAIDYSLMASDWGFELSDVSEDLNLFVYGGSGDNKCTTGMFRTLVKGLPKKNLKHELMDGEHHLLFFKLFQSRLLEDLNLSTSEE